MREDVSADESSPKGMMGEDCLTFRLNDGGDNQQNREAKIETCVSKEWRPFE